MKEVLSSMDIITIFFTPEIIRQNKCQMRFLEKLVLKQDVDKKLIINAITCSMLEYPSTSDYYEMENCVSKSTVLEPTTKHLIKETSLFRMAAQNLVSRGQNIGSKTSLMEKNNL